MRGKAANAGNSGRTAGITPAYAGKRGRRAATPHSPQDHPRICGEKMGMVCIIGGFAGSPPHMRGKVYGKTGVSTFLGITPAYAGKRLLWQVADYQLQDHPRICGEKPPLRCTRSIQSGSPPHMRGKVLLYLKSLSQLGITPAYAGKRRCLRFLGYSCRDHPRICGEKTKKIP